MKMVLLLINFMIETREPIYIPMASFITSYARLKTITTSQAIKTYSIENYGEDKYVYSDTDSNSHNFLQILKY